MDLRCGVAATSVGICWTALLEHIVIDTQIVVVLCILAFTVYLFVSEVVRVDVAAVAILTLLGVLSLVPALDGMVDVQSLYRGFGSNAVISIIAIMIIGAGLDRTGVVSRLADLILQHGGATEKRITMLLTTSVGTLSSFMQNVGAAALFIPIVSRISTRAQIPMSRLLMPMGFCAILGGTMTMVGSSPLILLNDLIETSNATLPADTQMERFGLFSVTPIGISLLVVGVLYFTFAGSKVLPTRSVDRIEPTSTMDYYIRTYGLDYALFEARVPPGSELIGSTLRAVERNRGVRIIGTKVGDDFRIEPWGGVELQAGMELAVFMDPNALDRASQLELKPRMDVFANALTSTKAGICELVVPPNSRLIDQTVRELVLRRTYGLAALAVHRAGETLSSGIRDLPLQAGDTLVCHSTWENLFRLNKDRDFVVVTTEYPHEESRPEKVGPAVFFFLLAISLVLFSDLRLATALLVGALGMIFTGVLSMDEAYAAVSWKTVFLLASLIPLGEVVQTTDTAAWIAQQLLVWFGESPGWVLQAAVALLATGFTLVMSNVGATVLLVPIAVSLATGIGADPALFALTVAIATSNSFLIPTHQVNALIMGPAGYKVRDFVRAGSLMSLLFLIVSLTMLNLLF